MNLNPKHPIADLVTKTGAQRGFHVEHILAWNEDNKALFDGDEERFEQERNRLGGILLLKGKDNISSNNEPYPEKLKSYANTLYWNESLRADSYKSKLDMTSLKDRYGLELEAIDQFGPDQLEVNRNTFPTCHRGKSSREPRGSRVVDAEYDARDRARVPPSIVRMRQRG